MYLKFLLIYSYLIINWTECIVLSASFPRLNFETYKTASGFKSTPPKPPVRNAIPLAKPVIRNDWPYARQPAYNPNFIGFMPAVLHPKPSPKPVFQPSAPTYIPHSNAIPKPVIRNDWPYTKQPAYNPDFKVPSTPVPAKRNLGPKQSQPANNTHFKNPSETTTRNQVTNQRQPPHSMPPSSTNQSHFAKPKQTNYNPDFKAPATPTPAKRYLVPEQSQPPYNPHFKEQTGASTRNQKSNVSLPHQNQFKPVTSTMKSHVLNTISPLYPLMTTSHQSTDDHRKSVVSEFGSVLGAIHTFVKQFTKNYNSTNVNQTFENPILLSPKVSQDEFPITSLIQSYSPEDSDFRPSIQKGLISNKLRVIHRHNLETRKEYTGKPFILVTIVMSFVVAIIALTGTIMYCSKKKK